MSACSNSIEYEEFRFESLNAKEHGVAFVNQLTYTEELNPYTYKSFFNGGGVGLGDLDNDGLLDIILTGSMVDNRIYRNLGGWDFEDVSLKSNLSASDAWTTGVSLADVNGDGLLDVYFCKAGAPSSPNRRNELLINQGGFEFLDIAHQAGVDDLGFGVQAAFFDYDKDGDLDMYLLNNSIRSVGGYDIRPGQREIPDIGGGNKLYRNQLAETDSLYFEDITQSSGIFSSAIGFGLGVSVSDINYDSWPDLYISNDFFERDYLYINDKKGGFIESLAELAPELSLGAMGADVADLTGDTYPEVFVSEMRPFNPKRLKSKTRFESWDRSELAFQKDYHRQYSRNTLLLNENGQALVDVSRQANVHSTDWSWGALAADLDNDGWKDLYIANGIFKDLLDQDYIHFVMSPERVRQLINTGGDVVRGLVDSMPSEPQRNFAFRNEDRGVSFSDSTLAWGLGKPNFSTGASYGDIDNDGDLDLIVSTINDAPLMLKNKTVERNQKESGFISLQLTDSTSIGNWFSFGTQVQLHTQAEVQYIEIAPVRGFMSTVDPKVHFGLKNIEIIDSIRINWSSGGQTLLKGVKPNQLIKLDASTAVKVDVTMNFKGNSRPSPEELTTFTHEESKHDDFDRYPLLLEMISAEGPASAVSKSGFIFLGGGKDQSAILLRHTLTGFKADLPPAFRTSAKYEDVQAKFADLDGDGDEDLLVGSGGDESTAAQLLLAFRAYKNTGKGWEPWPKGKMPRMLGYSCGAIETLDLDGDGDLDILFGTHFKLGKYGLPAESFALLNENGSGKFIKTELKALGIESLSRVRATSLLQMDDDPEFELAIAQEYGPISVYDRNDANWERVAASSNGLWRALEVVDVDQDGIDELIGGNQGLNTVFRADENIPLKFYVGDFDNNGSVEQVFTFSINGEESLVHQLLDLTSQMPNLRKKFNRFSKYSNATFTDVVDTSKLIVKYQVTELRTGLFRFTESEDLLFQPLPSDAQRTSIRAIGIKKNPLGTSDVILAGNYSRIKPELGGQLAGTGVSYRINKDSEMESTTSRLPILKGEVKGLYFLENGLFVARNNESPLWITNLDSLHFE